MTELSCNPAPMYMHVKLYRCDIIKARALLRLSSCRIPSDQSQWTKSERRQLERQERERVGGAETQREREGIMSKAPVKFDLPHQHHHIGTNVGEIGIKF